MDGQGGAGDRIGEAAGEEVGERERAVGVVVSGSFGGLRRKAFRACSTARSCRSLWALTRALKPQASAELGLRPSARSSASIGAVVVAGEIGADEGADARGLRVVGVDAEDDVGMPERGGPVGGVEAAAEVALLAAPGGAAWAGRKPGSSASDRSRRASARSQSPGAFENASGSA